ncbi:MAG TPA: hypothetical protein PLD99_01045, partial [Parcubacteria group bacterium]|nr:hypothetical protein [Parcubacteria group bacterium]
MKKRKISLSVTVGLVITLVASFLGAFSTPVLAQGAPSIISYQGRLADSGGNLLGSTSGTTYYFKFSIWDNQTVGSGSRVWPVALPGVTTSTVRSGVFNVNIGDTTNGYPDALDYAFSNPNIYLQVEVSADNSTYETLSPRQRLSSTIFAQVANSVLGASSTITTLTNTNIASTNGTTTNATSTNLFVSSLASTTQLRANIASLGNLTSVSSIITNLAGFGSRCVQTDNNGQLSVAAGACGTGGSGSGGGSWATTTSQTSSYIN